MRPGSASTFNPDKQGGEESSGRILAVNRESNFVIIDQGENTVAKLGDIMQVYRDGNNIATIEVIQVRPNISACDLKKESQSVKIGDRVK